MPQDTTAGRGLGPDEAVITQYIEPSIRNALPHYLPLCVFPLIVAGAIHGGWWLLPALAFMGVAGPRLIGRSVPTDGT